MRWLLSSLLFYGPLLALAIGCTGPDHDRFCEEAIGCAGGNDLDLEACVETLDLFRDNSDAQGCAGEYDDLFACAVDTATCMDVNTGFGCGGDIDCQSQGVGGVCVNNSCVLKSFTFPDQMTCEAERNAFSRCDKLGSSPVL